MSSTSRSLLATMISLALFGPTVAYANQAASENANGGSAVSDETDELAMVRGVCIAPEQMPADPNNEPIKVTADQAEALNNKSVTYTGDVIVRQGNRTVAADIATLEQPANVVTAEGNVYFHDGTIEVYSDRIKSNLDTEDSQLENAVYNMTCEAGRGEAERVTKNGISYYRLKNGTYTTCPAGDKSWQFSATSIEREADSPFADLYNARFEVADVPVFYMPYLRVPVGDERLTGFLYPSVSYGSRDGFELETPFYWNIAPNYDMTITPKYMSNRGLQLNADFRYLTELGTGNLSGEYLGNDQKDSDNDPRWGFNWSHNGMYNQHWLFEIDYSKVSDPTYFSDIDSSIGEREDNNLLQTAEVSYRDRNWDSTLRVRDFQPLTLGVSSSYRLMPQVEANYYYDDMPYGLDFSLNSHVSRFENDDPDKPTADRVHFEPTLTLPYATPWWSVTSEAKLMYTYYNQDFDPNAQELIDKGLELEGSVSRTVPSIRLHSGLHLERDTLIWGDSYTQSLEPQVQYLYVKDVVQKGIYDAYDTTLMQTDYYGLFRDKRYSSVDRIAAANQFTIGATSRYFDNQFKERFNIAVGQIFYLNESGRNLDSNNETSPNYSATALESDFNYDDWLFFHGGVQYDANKKDLQFANGAIEYREGSTFSQLNYRYISKEYLLDNILDEDQLNRYTEDGISQLGFSTGFPIYDGVSLRGDYYHDLTENQMLEGQISLNFRTSCWMISLGYNEYLKTRSNVSSSSTEYEQNFSISFSLIGLGLAPIGTTSDNNSIGYGRPFYLNN
ncbi:LPS assembly protein LptD [Photobacterium sp. ZSDE20]|uniref:LPS-assembly protein LptD n=1 Tax=Photobacterium pectinilyticum TaxID=2906793 RepID=A0ABT1N2M9_9GAMM|nr:LPS assembly protein LptD [Photobacterium sp. ZSDE20]MCQ1059001.1 LPS assembly protein LptD [Photobacterium sp. ZSDE20]MDD1824149.1 LPS assembly protein LptD [Photobacterium sp. ZSDE20]